MPASCQHSNVVSGPFCPDCGKPINTITREPGEIKMMLQHIKDLPPGPGNPMLRLVILLIATTTLKWALGQVPNEDFTKLLQGETDHHAA